MLSKAERTKQFILETAAPLYNEKGISGVSIDDVLAATKLTKGCLYGHFEGKEDLSAQVVDYSLSKMAEKIGQVVLKEKTAKGKIFAFMDFYKNPIDTYISGGCPFFNTAVEADDNFPDIKKKVAARLQFGQESLISVLEEGKQNGEFTARLDSAIFAFKMFAAIEGGIVLSRTLNDAKMMHRLIKNLKEELDSYTV